MPSFDVVSKVNMQEVSNALDQCSREIAQRYDFKASKSKVELLENDVVIVADDKMKLAAVQDILRLKLAKRGVSLKSVTFEDSVAAGGDTIRQVVKIKQGLGEDDLKALNKQIKNMSVRVTSQIQGDQLRVTGKKRDDLQEVIAHLRTAMQELDLQFINFRE